MGAGTISGRALDLLGGPRRLRPMARATSAIRPGLTLTVDGFKDQLGYRCHPAPAASDGTEVPCVVYVAFDWRLYLIDFAYTYHSPG